jgi:hypothetical protein
MRAFKLPKKKNTLSTLFRCYLCERNIAIKDGQFWISVLARAVSIFEKNGGFAGDVNSTIIFHQFEGVQINQWSELDRRVNKKCSFN